MRKAVRGFRASRIVWVAMMGSLALALAGCGDDDSGASGVGSTSGATTSGTGTTSSTPPQTATDAGSTTTSGSSTTTPPATSSTTTPPPASTTTSSTVVTLGWVAPTQNSNGTPITDLAGYNIHYGTVSQDYTQVVSITNPSLSRYVLDSLASGTYYFAISSYNSQGVESPLSGEITASLN
jgi:hypothetical protein